jgi:hypothetical protein
MTVAGVLPLALFIGGRYQRLAVEVPQGWLNVPENDRRARAQRAIAAAERHPVDWDELAQHRNAIDAHYRAKTRSYGEALAGGRMGLGVYHRNMVDALREGLTTQRRLGQGPLSYDAEQRLIDTLNEQMGYLDEFVGQIGRGELSAAQIVDRSGRYGGNTGLSYNAAIADAMAELADTEQRFLGQCTPHCKPCIEYDAQGRVPIGTLPPPRVRCDCRERCCCTLNFYDLSDRLVGWIG